MHRPIALICLMVMVTLSSMAISSGIMADSSVWKVSGDNGELLLGGSFHLLGKKDYPLPEEFDRAYGESTYVVLETDMAVVESGKFQQRLMEMMVYPAGTTLEDYLSEDVYKQLEDYCRRQGYPMDMIRTFKPGLVSVTLTVLKMQKMQLAGDGVDQHYYDQAMIEGKNIGTLETVDEQLSALASMGEGREDDMILNTLRDIESLASVLNDVKNAWRAGDNQRLQEVAMDPMRNEYPGIYQQLIVDRNNDWMPRLEALAATTEVEFVLVGALHLVGPDGLLEQMRQRGYTIERY